MENLKQYLDEDIKEQFNQLNIDISTVKVDLKNPEINIKQIANLMRINLIYKSTFANYYEDPFTFEVSLLEPTYRQRFTIAKMIINKLYNIQNKKNVLKQEYPDDNFIEPIFDSYLNKFARKILIPEKLFNKVKENIINENKNINKIKLKTKLSKAFNISPILIEEKL